MNRAYVTNDFAYVYDSIGNRISTEDSGQTTEYQANSLNQYTSVTSAALRELSYDLDGNMLTNGDWTYAWNGENRMVSASNSEHVISFSYDFQGRCYEKVKDGVTNSFIWDDYNIVSEISNSHTNYNIWGLDLSDSIQGAGGVGGLLATVQDGEIYFTAYDANGNITEYLDDTGTVVAHREYSAFGKTINLTGTKQNDFTHWFSTKPWDKDTGMSEYEFRKLLVGMGRFLNRDPIGEWGGKNLYLGAHNSFICWIDGWGLCEIEIIKSGEWKIIEIKLLFGTDTAEGGSADYQAFGSEAEATWEKELKVKCKCDPKEKNVTKTYTKRFPYNWEAVDFTAAPVDVPKPKKLWEAILELINKIREMDSQKDYINLAPNGMTPKSFENKLKQNAPQSDSDGEWKDGCPCPSEGTESK